MGTLRIGNDVVVPLLVQDSGGSTADTSHELKLQGDMYVPNRAGGICTSKDYYNWDNVFVINIIVKNLRTGNIYNAFDLLTLKQDSRNYFRVFVNAYNFQIERYVDNVRTKQIVYNNSSALWSSLINSYSYSITIDRAFNKLLIKSLRSNGNIETVLSLDLSEFDLDSLGDFQIVTELGHVDIPITAGKHISLNKYLILDDYLMKKIDSNNFSTFSPTVLSNEICMDNFTMQVEGTRIQTIDSKHVINSFSKTAGYCKFGFSNDKVITKPGFHAISKVKFLEVDNLNIYIGAGVNDILIFDEDLNLVSTKPTPANRFYPEANKWYIFQITNDATSQRNTSYVSLYGYNIGGSCTVDFEAIAIGFERKGNLGSLNWNGTYFTGDIPFLGESIVFNAFEPKDRSNFNQLDIQNIPMYFKASINGVLYMHNGTVWKQISS